MHCLIISLVSDEYRISDQVPQPLTKLPTFYWTWRFITMFTRACLS